MDIRYKNIWKFIRGDLKKTFFEEFIYNNQTLNTYLGEDLYLKVISNDYRDNNSTYIIKRKLKQYMEETFKLNCNCIKFRDTEVISMSVESCESISTIKKIKDRGMPYWWLSLQKCNICNQYWLFAQEERINDNFCLQRLSIDTATTITEKNEWPISFDNYADLLTLGNDEGKCFSFVEPLESPSIFYTIVDLARSHPKITVTELSNLLKLDRITTFKISKKAVKDEKVKIRLRK